MFKKRVKIIRASNSEATALHTGENGNENAAENENKNESENKDENEIPFLHRATHNLKTLIFIIR